MSTPSLPHSLPAAQDPPDPYAVALALLPLGHAALDVLWAAACHHGTAPHAQEWSPRLNAVGWWLCQFLAGQEAPDGC